MAKILIIGAGSFGTALAQVFSEKNDITVYSIEKDVIEDINKNHKNSKYLKDIPLNPSIKATGDLSVAKNFKTIVLGVPSQAAFYALRDLKQFYTNQVIIAVSKGLFKDGSVITDLILRELGCNKSRVVALSGPSIANELAKGLPAAVMLGGNRSTTRLLRKQLMTPQFYIKTTTDIKGIQLIGLYKNIVAILVGICNSLELGMNFRAALLAKAYSEFYYLNIGKNIGRHTFIDFGGLGDLFVTATSPDSRNIRFGSMLGQGKTIETIKKEIGQSIEGYENLLLLRDLKDKSYVDENLLNLLFDIIHNGHSREDVQKHLMKYLSSYDIKNIIFDWGAVITDGVYSENVAKIIAGKIGMDQKKVFKILVTHEKGILLGTETFQEYYAKIKDLLPGLSYPQLIAAFKDGITWNEKLLEYCVELKKNHRLFILSNNYSIVAEVLKKSRLKDIFEGMILSNDVGELKPGFAIYQKLLDKYKLRPENCIFIDDSEKNTKAAEAKKLNAIQFRDVEQLKREFEERFIF